MKEFRKANIQYLSSYKTTEKHTRKLPIIVKARVGIHTCQAFRTEVCSQRFFPVV